MIICPAKVCCDSIRKLRYAFKEIKSGQDRCYLPKPSIVGCYLEPSSDIPARNFDHKVIMQANKLAIKCFCVAQVSMWHHKVEFYPTVFKIKMLGFKIYVKPKIFQRVILIHCKDVRWVIF